MSAIENESLLKKLLHDLFSGNCQLNGEHQSFAADIFNHRQILQFFELLFEVSTDFPDVLQELFIFENLEVFQTGPARQRAAAERRAVLARLNRGGDSLVQEDSTERNAQAEWFCYSNHIGQQFFS